MTTSHFRSLLAQSYAAKRHSIYSHRNTPSRRTSKSTSHGTLNVHLKSFKVVPGVGLETQVIGLARKG